MRTWIIIVALTFTAGCWPFNKIFSQGSKGLRVKTTEVAATDDNWNRLDAAAKTLGWASVRGGKNDWTLKVTPKAGDGEIQMDDNLDTKTIRFVCDGGSLKDGDRCLAATNQLFGKAFNIELKK